MQKQIYILTLIGLFVLASLAVSGWALNTWNKTGWVGMFVSEEKVVSEIFQGGPADQAGIQVGDTVLSINSISIGKMARRAASPRGATADTTRLEELVSNLQAGDTLVYEIKRNEQALLFPLSLETPLSAIEVTVNLITNFIVGVAFLLFGIFVFSKKLQDSRALIFCLLSVVAAAYFFLFVHQLITIVGFDVSHLLEDFKSIIDIIETLREMATLLLASFFLHFALVFPRERPLLAERPRFLKWTYGLASLALLSYVAFALEERFAIDVPDVLLGIGVFLGGVILLFYPIVSLDALIESYRESKGEEKQQLRWPLWGLLIGVLGIFIIPNIPDAVEGFQAGFMDASSDLMVQEGHEPAQFEPVVVIPPSIELLIVAISSCLALSLPISFAFAILKYRLMDIDLIIKKTIIYSAVTGLIVLLYLGLVAGLGGFLVQSINVQNQWVIISSTLIVALVFVPVRNRVQEFIDHRFYRKRHDYPQLLKQLGSEVHDAADQKELLNCIAENLQQTLPNRATVIFLKSQNDENFWLKEKIGLPDELLGQLKIVSSSPLLSQVEDIYQPSNDQLNLPETDRHILQQIRADLLVPVKTKGELVGLITMGKKLSDLDYDEDDRDYLLGVSQHLAVGLEQVRLRAQEKEFEQAREIQQRLLPSEIPQIQGFEIVAAWQPARSVSGDYYDVLKFSDRKLGLCIADVVGKGMPAALLMSNIQAAVKAFATETTQPKDVCTQVNRFLRNNIAQDQFITFFYCLLDADAQALTYTRAGHNPPFLIRKDGSHTELETGGPALGILENYDLPQQEIMLSSGDRILLYTDGVTEAMNAENEEFGEARLLDLLLENRILSADALQNRVMTDLAEFTHGAFQDDVTMVVVAAG